MLRPLSSATRIAPWLAAAALVYAIAAPGPNAALAQTAGDLKCNKCVGTGDLGRKAVTKDRIKKNAVTFGKLNPKVVAAIQQSRAVYVTLDSNGAEATLATQGPLRIFARCVINDAGVDRVEIVGTSTANGWFLFGERTPGEEVNIRNLPAPTGATAFLQILSMSSMLAPDGSTIGGGTRLGLGLNVFGHACLVEGSVAAFTGNP